MAAYPSTLPALVAQDYGVQPFDPVVRTQMDVGSARSRRISQARADTVPCSVVYNDAQYKAFREWFDDPAGAAGGAAWFDFRLAVGEGGKTAKEVKFKSIWRAQLVGPLVWRVSMELETR